MPACPGNHGPIILFLSWGSFSKSLDQHYSVRKSNSTDLKYTLFINLADDHRVEKKQSVSSTSVSNKTANTSSNGAEKEPIRKESEKTSSKESKRDKEESETRKRERSEKRRERYIASPTWYESSSQDRNYPSNDIVYERDRDRDLSSISNSSNGSTNRRSHESPEHDRGESRANSNQFMVS